MDDYALKTLVKYLSDYEGDPILFEMPSDTIKELIFFYDEDCDKYIFAIDDEFLKKIDFSNISFDKVDVSMHDFSGCMGLHINPQTVYNKDMHGSKFENVIFTGTFDGCNIDGTIFKNNKYVATDMCGEAKALGMISDSHALNEARKVLVEQLSKYEGKPILLDMPSRILKDLIFDYDEKDNKYVFAIPDDLLMNINFSNISFDNVDVSEHYFGGFTGLHINPQTVYHKQLHHSWFENVIFTGPFDDVEINDVHFIANNTNVEIDPQTVRNKDLSYCSFHGVKFTSHFSDVNIEGANFSESTGAIIVPGNLKDKSLHNTILKDACITPNFNDVDVRGANFRGTLGPVLIDPQKVKDKSLEHAILDGVTFIGPFSGVKINVADFSGSIGAVICLQSIFDSSLVGTKLRDATVYGSFKNTYIEGADFSGYIEVEGAPLILNPQEVGYKSLRGTNLRGVTIIGSFKDVIVTRTKFVGAKGEIKIDPQEVNDKNLYKGDFSGVEFTGPFEDTNIIGASFKGSKGAVINTDKVYYDNETVFEDALLNPLDIEGLPEDEKAKMIIKRIISQFK